METQYSLLDIIRILTRNLSEHEEKLHGDIGLGSLSPGKIRCLDFIAQMKNPTPTELAAALNITKPSVTAMLDKLAAEGFIRKVRSDEDARSLHVHLTDKGENVAELHDGIHEDLADHFTANLNPDETIELIRLLNKVIRTF
jgi:DNA-binding MarR family transcriptional regulator